MSILALPPELVQLVFDHAIPEPWDSLEHAEYLARTACLLSLALVHPSWTPTAQAMLHRDIWLNEGDEGMARKGRQIARNAKRYPTRSLMVEGSLDVLVSVVCRQGDEFNQVTSLEHRDEENTIDLRIYENFPRLETLTITCGLCRRPTRDETLSLLHLWRLVIKCQGMLRRSTTDPDGYGTLSLLSPSTVPLLRHLACEIDDSEDWCDLFGAVCEQIESFAMVDENPEWGEWQHPHVEFLRPDRFTRLKTLTLNAGDQRAYVGTVLSHTNGFDLDALHVGIYSSWEPVSVEDHLIRRLAEIVRGEVPTFRSKRVVVYDFNREYFLGLPEREFKYLDALEVGHADDFPRE